MNLSEIKSIMISTINVHKEDVASLKEFKKSALTTGEMIVFRDYIIFKDFDIEDFHKMCLYLIKESWKYDLLEKTFQQTLVILNYTSGVTSIVTDYEISADDYIIKFREENGNPEIEWMLTDEIIYE